MVLEFAAAAQKVLDDLPPRYQEWVRDALGRVATNNLKPGSFVRVLGQDVDLAGTVSDCGARLVVEKIDLRLHGLPPA